MMKRAVFRSTSLAVALGLLHGAPLLDAAFPKLALKPVVLNQIHAPTNIVNANDGSGRLFVSDQLGKIYIIQGGMMLPTPFLNIASPLNASPDQGPGPVLSVSASYSERGLLGLVFHPGFANESSPGYRKFYVNYTKTYDAVNDPAPPQAGDPVNCVTVIAEFQVSASNPNVADPASERRVLAYTQPQSNHNGGQLEFGPDGLLYIGVGDGGSQDDNNAGHTGGSASRPTNNLGNSQDKTRFLGKILRIDPVDPDGAGPLTYTIPATNPFFSDSTPNLKKEIYAYGLRNPWRFSFDKRSGVTNRLFCGDVGGGRIEEVNIIVAGGNYGWRYKEGTELPTFSSGASTNPMAHPGGTLIDPIAMYAHTGVVTTPPLPQLGLSITGGYIYRGAAIAGLQGKFVFSDYGSTSTTTSWNSPLMGLEETSPGVFALTQAIPLLGQANPIVGQRILCLGEDESGEIYVGMKTNAGVLLLDNGLPAGGIYKIMPVQTVSTQLTVEKDNTIFSEDLILARDYSDALGNVYAGRTGDNFGPYLRRGLIAFDVSSIPSSAVITSAQVKLFVDRTGPGSGGTILSLHRLNETWGEGTSYKAGGGIGVQATVPDATWRYRSFNTTMWSTAGGAFQATASATIPAASGLRTWGSTAQLQSDVQGWVNGSQVNAGWIIRGDETGNETACRFHSKQQGTTPPALVVSYEVGPQQEPFEAWRALYFPTYLVGQFIDPNGDDDRDGVVNQLEYAFGRSPVQADSSTYFTAAPTAGGADFTVSFPRDNAATDLTYRLQVSSDLSAWTTIAQSAGGNSAVPQNGGEIVSDDGLDGTINLVTVRYPLPVGAGTRQFARVQVDR
ncbi:MAG: PQQ-dependent sugar dehydrogenase [Roseimicrobium sp.]